MDNNLSLSLRGPNGAAAIRNPTTKKRIPTENAAQWAAFSVGMTSKFRFVVFHYYRR